MKYAILFDSPADRDTIAALLKSVKIGAVTIETISDSALEDFNTAHDMMLDMVNPVCKHRRDLERAERAFQQDPSPRLATAIKQLHAAIRKEEKKVSQPTNKVTKKVTS